MCVYTYIIYIRVCVYMYVRVWGDQVRVCLLGLYCDGVCIHVYKRNISNVYFRARVSVCAPTNYVPNGTEKV